MRQRAGPPARGCRARAAPGARRRGRARGSSSHTSGGASVVRRQRIAKSGKSVSSSGRETGRVPGLPGERTQKSNEAITPPKSAPESSLAPPPETEATSTEESIIDWTTTSTLSAPASARGGNLFRHQVEAGAVREQALRLAQPSRTTWDSSRDSKKRTSTIRQGHGEHGQPVEDLPENPHEVAARIRPHRNLRSLPAPGRVLDLPDLVLRLPARRAGRRESLRGTRVAAPDRGLDELDFPPHLLEAARYRSCPGGKGGRDVAVRLAFALGVQPLDQPSVKWTAASAKPTSAGAAAKDVARSCGSPAIVGVSWSALRELARASRRRTTEQDGGRRRARRRDPL